jgi:hypothetical protein
VKSSKIPTGPVVEDLLSIGSSTRYGMISQQEVISYNFFVLLFFTCLQGARSALAKHEFIGFHLTESWLFQHKQVYPSEGQSGIYEAVVHVIMSVRSQPVHWLYSLFIISNRKSHISV